MKYLELYDLCQLDVWKAYDSLVLMLSILIIFPLSLPNYSSTVILNSNFLITDANFML